jgi:hypothetical protein
MADPLRIIGEILGEPANSMRNPVNAEYRCPFTSSTCVKRGHNNVKGPYPVCSIHRSKKDQRLICVCPKRFFEADLQNEVIKYCWKGEAPENPRVAYEVKMKPFGTVDMVIADIDESRNYVRNFVSVELQAVDITGSVEPAYTAIIDNVEQLDQKVSYGINWANVRKRYVTQLITKGIFHHHWRTRIVCVLQTQLYESFRKDIEFDEMEPNQNCNIIFMMYDFRDDPEKETPGAVRMVLDKVVGTSHSSLMTGSLYREAPPRQEFCNKILERL